MTDLNETKSSTEALSNAFTPQLMNESLESNSLKKQLQWSQTLKHDKIAINGRTMSRIAGGQNRYGYWGICGLANSFAEHVNCNIYKWSIKIKAFKEWMYVGLC